jgi:POT family proton-dependent oligopeptide transporter
MADSMPSADTSFFGHPRRLATLFFVEMWERFSYYGMRALLILYMTAAVGDGGLGMPVAQAGALYGTYTASVYFASLPGGWLADRFFGQQRAVLYGGILIAIGQFVLAAPGLTPFYLGLTIIAGGTGLLKANASTIVGQLYAAGDRRRDAGFSIFYMGINLGAFLSPLICGYIGQRIDWRLGFAAAGVGMILGLIQYLTGRRTLGDAGLHPGASQPRAAIAPGAERDETRRLMALGILLLGSIVFWALYEQAGSTLNLFAEDRSDNRLFGYSFPSSWYQALPALFVIALAPVFAWIWIRLKDRDPSPVVKFTLGLVFVGAGFLLLVPAAYIADGGQKVSPMWLVGVYFLHTVGELCLSPVGLSATTKLAPARMAGLLMGVFFLTLSAGNYLGGQISTLYGRVDLVDLFRAVGLAGVAAGLVLLTLNGPMKRLMGESR